MRVLTICLLFSVVVTVQAAVASGVKIQYRDGSAATLTGKDPTLLRMQSEVDDAQSHFDLDGYVDEAVMLARPFYQEFGYPRIVLYLNQVFSNAVNDFIVIQKQRLIKESEALGTAAGEDLNFEVHDTLTTETQQRLAKDGPYALPAQIFISQFKSGVSKALRRVPVRQVDQSIITRLAAGNSTPENLSKNEMMALSQYADYLAEFLFIPDGESVNGFSVEMRLIRVTDGMLMGMDVFEPTVLGEITELEITESGFQKAVYQDIPTPYGVGLGSGATLLNLFTESAELLRLPPS